jgi:o-succinylbenzoate synthase
MDLEIEPRRLRFRAPLATAFGVLEERDLLEVRVRDAEGRVGRGEAAPLPGYDAAGQGAAAALAGRPMDAVRAEVEACRELLVDGESLAALRAACRRRCSIPQALAALDVALWDLEAQRAGLPLARLLSPRAAGSVTVNALIAATDREGASREAAAAAAAGFRCVKVKVGVGDDAGRLAAVRAAVGRSVAIRIDANGAWSPEEAVAALRALAPVGIELCEEPVHGAQAIRAVRAALAGAVPLALDESAREPGALAASAADAVCLKVAGCGGITDLLRDAATARSTGADVYVASTFDGPVGIAAGVHVAAALHVARACGLATLALFADVENPLPPSEGAIAVPAEPGLGLPAEAM